MSQEKMTAQTAAERKAAERRRKAAAGLTEVRGIYARTADHAKIKRYAKALKPAPADQQEG